MRRIALVPFALLVACLVPASASAADIVIGFDDLAPGTKVTNQYESQGIVLGRAPAGDTGQVHYVRASSGGGNDLEVSSICPPKGGNPSCSYRLDARLDFARQNVKVTVRQRFAATELTAYTSTGAVIDTATQPEGPAAPYVLEVNSAKQDIQFISITGAANIDDITYDNPANPPPPDFSIFAQALPFQPPGLLRIKAGDEATVNVLVNRFNFSSGPIRITPLLDTTTGVSVESKVTSGPDGTLVPITVKVPASAKPGNLPVTLRATPDSIAAAPATTVREADLEVSIFRDYDLQVTGIEVTQGIQREVVRCTATALCDENISLPFRNFSDPTAPVPYNNAPLWTSSTLVAGKRTVARVYGNVRDPAFPKGITVKDAGIQLSGFAGGKKLPESPLQPEIGVGKGISSGGPDTTSGGAGRDWVTFKDRADRTQGTMYTLPDSWTRKKNLTLRAEVVGYSDPFDHLDSRECDTSACKANNVFTLSGIPFQKVGSMKLATAWLYTRSDSRHGPKDANGNPMIASEILDESDLLIPFAEGDLQYAPDFYASINVQEVKGDNFYDSRDAVYAAKDMLEDYADEYPGCEWADFCADMILGMYSKNLKPQGGSDDDFIGGTSDSDFPEGVAVVRYERPVSAAHEISHNLGREHAGEDCEGIGENGQTAEDWPPDERGVMDGVGLDTRPGSGGPKQTYAVKAPGNLGAPAGSPVGKNAPPPFGFPDVNPQPAEYFDQQSYCHDGDFMRWTSAKGLERFFVPNTVFGLDAVPPSLDLDKLAELTSAGASAASARARGSQRAQRVLHVQALAKLGGDAKITVVKERVLRPRPAPDSSPYHLVVRDAGGAVLADVPMAAEQYEPDPIVQLTGQAAVSGAASVEVTLNGAPIASRARSASRPSVRILSPRKGATVGRKRSTVVRWRSRDADSDRLRVKIDYSFDNGRGFTPIHVGLDSGRAAIPSHLLSGSRKARLRVRVSDGFNEGQATSGRLRALGRPPRVRMLAPVRGQRISRDAWLSLGAEGYDDRRRRLGGRALRWYVGKRRIARGRLAAVTGLPPGRRRIRVVARDRNGRTASASAIVRILPVKPRLTRLVTPRRVKRRARSVALTVAANVPARLTAGGRSYKVGRRARRIRVRIRPGRRPLRIRARLASGGRSSRGVIAIRR